jgi:hypothetical protein
MITREQAEKYLEEISGGTTCRRFYKVVDVVGDYIVAHHTTHFGSYDRMGGFSTSCKASHRVYKYAEKPKSSHDCIYPLFEVGGRYTNEKKKQLYDFIEKEMAGGKS